MPPTLINPAPFPLLPGETLWRLDGGPLVTVQIIPFQDNGVFLSFNVTGRALAETGEPVTTESAFHLNEARAIVLPLATHSLSHAALADPNANASMPGKFGEWTTLALTQWASYLPAVQAMAALAPVARALAAAPVDGAAPVPLTPAAPAPVAQ